MFSYNSEVNDYFKVLDQRAKDTKDLKKHFSAKSTVRVGEDANTIPLVNAPRWSVDKDWQKA